MNAAFYYRAAEFYTFNEAGDKELFYSKFSKYFQLAFQEDKIEQVKYPINPVFFRQ